MVVYINTWLLAEEHYLLLCIQLFVTPILLHPLHVDSICEGESCLVNNSVLLAGTNCCRELSHSALMFTLCGY
jgi:hypothetical protein